MDYLRELQLTELEILNEIHRVCTENNLKYFLVGGTLLGAVRHKGFIPWDDDLDIAMPRNDYNKFLKICETELNGKYYLHCINTDEEYWLPFSKIRKKNTLFDEANISHLDVPKGIYVDVFPLDDEFKENSFEKKLRTKLLKSLNSIIVNKKRFYVNKKKTFKTVIRNTVTFLFAPFSIKKIQSFQIRLMSKNNNKGGSYYANYGSNYDPVKQTMQKSVYEPVRLIEFEGNYYSAPNDYEYMLKRIYGDNYMQLPPEEKRVTHKPVRISFNTKEESDNEGSRNEEV